MFVLQCMVTLMLYSVFTINFIQGWTQKVWRRGGGGRGHWPPKACIKRRKLREGESMRGVSPLIRGSGGLPGKFLKLDCLRVHFHAIFQSFSLILQADFFFWQFQEVAGSKTAGATFFCGIVLSLPLNSRRAVVSFWQKDVYCTGYLLMYKPAQEVRICKLTGSKIT